MQVHLLEYDDPWKIAIENIAKCIAFGGNNTIFFCIKGAFSCEFYKKKRCHHSKKKVLSNPLEPIEDFGLNPSSCPQSFEENDRKNFARSISKTFLEFSNGSHCYQLTSFKNELWNCFQSCFLSQFCLISCLILTYWQILVFIFRSIIQSQNTLSWATKTYQNTISKAYLLCVFS